MSKLNTDELFKLIYDSYHMSVVSDDFCYNNREIEELANISPVISTLRHKLDLAYAMMIDYREQNQL